MVKNSKSAPTGLVYSTDLGRMCPECRQAIGKCICKKARATTASDGIVRIRLETKGRKGKGVTVISGVPIEPAELESLGRELKQRCGSGGTVKDGIIEIQGDHRDTLHGELTKRGWTVKRTGG